MALNTIRGKVLGRVLATVCDGFCTGLFCYFFAVISISCLDAVAKQMR